MVNIEIYNNGNSLCGFYDVKLEKWDSNTREIIIINGDKKIFVSLGSNDTVVIEDRFNKTEDVPF